MVVRFLLSVLVLLAGGVSVGTLRAQDEPIDLVSIEKRVMALSKTVERFDRDASRFLEKELLPALLSPSADPEILTVFEARLDRMEELNMGPFPEQFGYVRSVQAALTGDSLRIPFPAWDAAVALALEGRRSARDFQPLLVLGKDLLLDGIFHRTQSVEWEFEGAMAMALPDDGPPRLVLGPSGTLRALAKGDTLEVQRTGGHYDHGAERFEGRSGRVDWGRSGWDPERNYADFDAFSIRLKTPSLTVDSARFTTELFPDPLLGQLTDKARARKRDEKTGEALDAARYPRFDTYVNRLSMPDIVPGVDFQGGLTVRGAELQGKGTEEEPAELDFRRADTVLVKCRASLFILKAQQFGGQGVEAIVRLGADSVYHPELNLRFDLASQRLSLVRTQEGLGPRPFLSLIHI